VRTSVDVETADASDTAPGAPFVGTHQLPDHTLPLLYPGRYCEADRFAEMAAALVHGHSPGYDQCRAIVDHIKNTIQYTPGNGQDIISAGEVNQLGQGAHLGIACGRALSIPARMVVGYLRGLEPTDLHAWFEAYLGNRWYSCVAIAFGRDAADVAIYTQFGNPVELISMAVTVTSMTGPLT